MAERALTYTQRRGSGTVGASTGQGLRNAMKVNTWHPTVINLLVLIVLEMAVYALLRYSFRQFHGG